MPQQHEEARREPFGYRCRACSRCCQGKIIQVNPYEIARLAARIGMTGASFRAQCTEDGAGAHLKRDENDRCIFLNAAGCSVHEDRPLVCRLYPLGRRVAADGTEEWVHVEPHPLSEGEYHKNGSIADFLAAQGAAPYMRAADAYASWVRRAIVRVQQLQADGGEAAGEALPPDWLDMDAAIEAHAAATGSAPPQDIEARCELHLEILYRQLDAIGEDPNQGEGNDQRS